MNSSFFFSHTQLSHISAPTLTFPAIDFPNFYDLRSLIKHFTFFIVLSFFTLLQYSTSASPFIFLTLYVCLSRCWTKLLLANFLFTDSTQTFVALLVVCYFVCFVIFCLFNFLISPHFSLVDSFPLNYLFLPKFVVFNNSFLDNLHF